jgi:MFS transporter, PPP family, 3-phenylpropionic acid transporter
MHPHPPKSTAERFALRLALVYAALFTTLGVQLPFLPVWFAAKGLNASEIGVALALPMIVRMFAIPMATRVADRRDALRAVIISAAAAATLGFCLLGLVEGGLAIMAMYGLASVAATPVTLLVDAYALRGLAQRGLAYGPVRLWGSAAFILSSVGAGFLLDLLAPRDLIWLIVAALALSAAASWVLAPLAPMEAVATPGAARSAIGLLRNRSFVAIVLAGSLIQSSHALYYGFSTIDWQTAGFDGSTIGALWALGVLAEIVLFAVSGRLPAAVTPKALIMAGSVGGFVRWGAMALDPPASLLPALQCLHALSFGATHLGTLTYITRVAPPGLGATAQGYFVVAFGMTMAVMTGLSGVLYGRYGGLAYGAMALAAAAGGLFALATRTADDGGWT